MKTLPYGLSLVVALAGLGIGTCGEEPSGADTVIAAKLRGDAKALIGVLPGAMPGAESDSPLMIDLGRKLFFDTRLSGNGTMSCNSCHAVDKQMAGVDNQPTSPGAFGKRGDRNSPTVLNAGFHFAQFWDGRAATLEEQAKGPILNPIEMGMPSEEDVLKNLRAVPEYQEEFRKAFPKSPNPITYDNVGEAIAAFERTLITRDRFDDFQKGDDRALSEKELKGLDLFVQLGCTTCHNGPLLGGSSYQKVGLVNTYENTKDLGRFAVTKDEDDKFKFKVPSLRNIDLTAPYFHDGRTVDLGGAVRKMAWLQLGLELTDEQAGQLVAFLQSLSDKELVLSRSK
jgi:cytochrome c peroxidase